MVVYKSDKIIFGTHFRSCLCWFVGRNMYHYTISISICLAILSACAADKTEQAYSSISYHRHDVPLSYNFSQVHIYTKYPESTRVKHIKPRKYQIEQHTNTIIDVEKKHENIQEDNPQDNEHDDKERNTQSQQIYNDLPSDILQNVETLEAVNHKAQKEHIKEHPQGFSYPQTQEHSTPAYNSVYFHGIPIQYYLNRAANLKSKAPEESINTNSLGNQNENVYYLQNKEPNRQHPSFQQQYDIPTVQLSKAHSHNIANVPNKAFTKIYNVERP